MNFYDLSEGERAALTEHAIAERRTVIERWTELADPEAAKWTARAARAAALLADCSAVADVGCGTMQLESYLTVPSYIPVDVVRRDARTVVVDLNREELPDLPVDGYALIGLLEYLFDVPALLRRVSGTVVVTYNPTDLKDFNRKSHAWVNAYSTAELEALFAEAGLTIEASEPVGHHQRLWKLRR